MLEFSVSNGLN